MLRIAVGDTNLYGSINYIESPFNEIFWSYWILSVVVSFIIFLNLVIIKAVDVSERIQKRLSEFILRDRADMLYEADSMQPNFLKSITKYPKYFVIREEESQSGV